MSTDTDPGGHTGPSFERDQGHKNSNFCYMWGPSPMMDRDRVLQLTAIIHALLEPQLVISLYLVSYFSISFSIFLLTSLLS